MAPESKRVDLYEFLSETVGPSGSSVQCVFGIIDVSNGYNRSWTINTTSNKRNLLKVIISSRKKLCILEGIHKHLFHCAHTIIDEELIAVAKM